MAHHQPKPPKRTKTVLNEKSGFGHVEKLTKKQIEEARATAREEANDATDQEGNR